MTERGWTQKDVVAASGMRKDQVSVYARGLQMPRPEAMTRLASAFGVHEEALLPGIGRRRSGGAGHDVYILDAVPGAPDLMRIHLRRVLPARVALRIASLVSESGGGFG
jgi:transcriptional regulator with XRE-family HTH domain